MPEYGRMFFSVFGTLLSVNDERWHSLLKLMAYQILFAWTNYSLGIYLGLFCAC